MGILRLGISKFEVIVINMEVILVNSCQLPLYRVRLENPYTPIIYIV